MRERELTVAGLAATLALPEGDVRGGVVPLHPASDGSRRQFLFEHLVDTLVPRGVAVLRFDRRPSPAGDVPFEGSGRRRARGAPRSPRTAGGRRGTPRPVGVEPGSMGGRGCGGALNGGGVSDPARRLWGEPGRADALRHRRAAASKRLRRRGVVPRAGRAPRRARERPPRPGASRRGAGARRSVRGAPWFPLAYVSRTLDPAADWPDMDFDPAPILASVQCPVLLFYGEEDEWTPIEPSVAAWRRAAALTGNTALTVVRLPGTDHAPTIGGVQEPDAISPRYTQALVDWVDDRLAER